MKNQTSDPEFDPDTPFTIILIEKSKTGQLLLRKLREKIASIRLEEFLDSLDCIEEDVVQWSFEIKDLVVKILSGIYIQTKDKYAKFTERLSKLELKRKVFLKLINVEKDKEEEDS